MKPWMSARTSSGRRAVWVVTGSQLLEKAAQAIGRRVRTGAREREIVEDIQYGFLRVRAEEQLGWDLMASEKLLERRQISRAARRESIRGLPDRLQPRED